AKEAAANATRAAVDQLNGHEPGVALFFDCVATRLRMGREFGNELDALKEVLGETQFAGCNTYGQVARTTGQFNGFHNCTAVVCVLPA
nr:FIST C-terminal domain-containing protein [Chthoniobacterales bacterium]